MKLKKIRIIALATLFVLMVTGCSPAPVSKGFTHLKRISELATLKAYYHNVAEKIDGGVLVGIGYQKMWIEYAGIVTIGINPSKVTLTNPDDKGVVKVTIPKAEVLGIDFDENSIKEYADGNLAFTGLSFSTTQKLETLSEAQNNMKLEVSSNESLLLQGQDRAKEVIEKYIQSVGNSIGKTYTVEWIELNEE